MLDDSGEGVCGAGVVAAESSLDPVQYRASIGGFDRGLVTMNRRDQWECPQSTESSPAVCS